MIPVVKPFLPPIEEYEQYLKDIWQRNWLTNHGPLVNELELRLKDYLGLDHLLFVTNGTIALQIAIKALNIKGEVITTPFSYVATTNSLIWEGCVPIFADIDPESLNIDPHAIEKVISEKTTAILATHVYGNPCDIIGIEKIAQKHNLKIIYDGAHCFGTKFKEDSVLSYGDISTLSFHATKLFHTIEGGAVICKDPELLKKMSYLRNFGHEGPYDFYIPGINGKNSEFHAAMGLCNLKYIGKILSRRKELVDHYNLCLERLDVLRPKLQLNSTWNYAYYPIIFDSEISLLQTMKALEKQYIYTRRYFYPSLNTISYTHGESNTPHSESIAKRILCLPLYHTLSKEEIDMIARIILRTQRYGQ